MTHIRVASVRWGVMAFVLVTATLVLLLRGCKGEPTGASRATGLHGKSHTLRQRIQANLNETAPTDAMCGDGL